MAPPPPLLIDGSTGEGGGQLVRIAVTLSALTGTPIKIINIRANRTRSRPVGKRGSVQVTGGGLKNQHIAAIKCLASASVATVTGLTVGSRTLTFTPTLSPSSFRARTLKITPESDASSALLIFQALLPFLLFTGGESVEVEIEGGTNTSWSLSYEYADQVLLPALEEKFGVRVERRLQRRGWSLGGSGCMWVKINPVKTGASLIPRSLDRDLSDPRNFEVASVEVSLIVPLRLQDPLQTALANDISSILSPAEIKFKVVEDSGHPLRIYLLLVATSPTGLRWGVDRLHMSSKKSHNSDAIAATLSRQAVKQLVWEVNAKGEVDVNLQDQLVCFQALAAGRSSIVRHGAGDKDLDEATSALGALRIGDDAEGSMDMSQPFGHGSMHTRTARWVAARLLPGVQFFKGGDVVEGAGVKFAEDSTGGRGKAHG